MEGYVSHQLSANSHLSEEKPSANSPFLSRSTTMEGFLENMDERGDHIPNMEETNQGETNGEESSIKMNTFEYLIQNLGATLVN